MCVCELARPQREEGGERERGVEGSHRENEEEIQSNTERCEEGRDLAME